MAYKKKTKIEELQEELRQVTHEMKVAFKQAKKYSRKGEMGKALQAQTRWCQLKDKRPILQKELEELSAKKEMGEDSTVPFVKETFRLAFDWCKNTDEGYYFFINNIMLRKTTTIEDVKEVFGNRMNIGGGRKLIDEAERLIAETYCRKNNLEIRKKEGGDKDEKKEDKEESNN